MNSSPQIMGRAERSFLQDAGVRHWRSAWTQRSAKIVTTAERGNAAPSDRPEFPCVGTNAMNFANVNRATQGLVAYMKEWHAKNKIRTRPKIVIAHDTRFFSKEFTDLTAKVAAENGCDAFIFDGPRSTPELSFAVRHLNATAGIVITASHNPPHDNGYKVYFTDGAQVIEPHASGNHRESERDPKRKLRPAAERSTRQQSQRSDQDVDEAYMNRLETIGRRSKRPRTRQISSRHFHAAARDRCGHARTDA